MKPTKQSKAIQQLKLRLEEQLELQALKRALRNPLPKL